MIKKLPLKLDADITTDCWSFYHFSIIGADCTLDDWIANHYTQIYLNESDYECHYGMGGMIYNQLDYYDSVINTERAYINEFKDDDEIIQFIIETIDSNKYIQLECNTPTLLDHTSDIYIHEFLIYGYDLKEKVFFCPIYNEIIWEEKKIPMQHFIEAYNARKSLKNVVIDEPTYKRLRNYTITIFSLRSNCEIHLSVELLYDDLQYILMESYSETRYTNQIDVTHNGVLSVLKAYIKYCDRILNKELYYDYTKYKFSISLKTLFEYIALLSKRIRILENRFNLNISEELYQKLTSIETNLKKMFNLSVKYSIDKKERSILQIKQRLENAVEELKCSLDHLIPYLKKYIADNK